MFKHLVITQFNLQKFPRGEKTVEFWIEWTRERIKLFEKFCLPSFLNQTNKNFEWLLYFDQETPIEFGPFFERLKKIDFIRISYAKGYANFDQKYLDDINTYKQEHDLILTTRVDNDDSLHKDAIKVIQANFKPQDEFLISLTSGYVFDTNQQILAHYYYPMSPFISLIEDSKNDSIKGIFYVEHSKWTQLRMSFRKELLGQNSLSLFIYDQPYWMQVAHGKNVSNTFKRGFPVLKPMSLSDFGVDITTKGQSASEIPSYFDYPLWKKYFKASLLNFLKK